MRVNSSLACGAVLLAAAICVPAFGQATGQLKTKVNPGRAGVFVDGKYVGPAANFGHARKYALAAGEHEIRLTEPRYEDIVKKITIEAGKTTTLSESMKALPLAQPPFGRLRTVGAEKYSAVYLNGKYVGHADEFSNPTQGLLLNPGSYAIKVVPPGGGDVREQQVTIEADKVTVFHVQK